MQLKNKTNQGSKMFNFFRKTDEQIQQEVLNQLKCDHGINTDFIQVNVHEGTVTLEGSVQHFLERTKAKEAALRVYGVQEVIDDLKIHLENEIVLGQDNFRRHNHDGQGNLLQ